MIPARFKVHNYCSIVWTPPLPGGKIASGRQLSASVEQIVDSASCIYQGYEGSHGYAEISGYRHASFMTAVLS